MPGEATTGEAEVKAMQRALAKIGWQLQDDGVLGPATRSVVRKFQNGFAGPGGPLPDHGELGVQTRAAIEWSVANQGRCSDHFAYREFRSKGNGDIVVLRPLIVCLERLRDAIGKPITIVSGYRDPHHNKKVGGARFSQHLYGTAADIPEGLRVTIPQATDAGFSGIGFDEDNDFVEHVDVRHAGPNNTTGSQPGRPMTWKYS